jgi:glycopeptide antibiotics resistance protein
LLNSARLTGVSPSPRSLVALGLYLLVLLPALLLPLPTTNPHLMEFRASRPWLSLDVALNVAVFVPLGWLLARVGHRRGLSRLGAVLLTAGGCGALSLSAETVQFFLSSRYSSVIDVVANTTGALLGAVVGRPRYR